MQKSELSMALESAQLAIRTLSSRLDIAFSTIRQACLDSESGRLDAIKLDEFQQVSYELAFVVAERAATSALIAQAKKRR